MMAVVYSAKEVLLHMRQCVQAAVSEKQNFVVRKLVSRI